MTLEIERKFLVENDGWRERADAGRRLRQAYLAETECAVIRVRIEEGAQGWLTIKSAVPGLSRQEFEFPITRADAEELVQLRQGGLLEKTRWRVQEGDWLWEVDVYEGENRGLVIAEIELESEQAELRRPLWLGREVTGEARYYASRLAQAPFRSWREPR